MRQLPLLPFLVFVIKVQCSVYCHLCTSLQVPVKAITNALTQVTSAFNHLLDLAHQYDDTYKLSTHVSGILTHPREEVRPLCEWFGGLAEYRGTNFQGLWVPV